MRARRGLIALGLLLVIAAGLYGFGTNLPPTHSVTRKMVLHQPRDAVWEAVTQYQDAPAWSPSVAKVERRPDLDGQPVWRLFDHKGGYMDIAITEEQAPSRHVSRILASSYPFAGSWSFDLEEAGERTLVTLTEEGEVQSPLWRLLMRYVMGQDRLVRAYLQELGGKFGETPHIAG